MQKISSDEYLAIENTAEDKLVVKGSVFLAGAYPVKTRNDAEDRIKEIREKYFDATHNCYAYILGKGTSKSSDAGEPKGTAGKQILKAIQSKDLNYVLLVVTRYFGGTKLGTSGLSKAYKESALNALNKCKVIKRVITTNVCFSFPVSFYGNVSKTISKFDCQVLNTDFLDEVQIETQIRKRLAEEFQKALVDSTEGKIRFF